MTAVLEDCTKEKQRVKLWLFSGSKCLKAAEQVLLMQTGKDASPRL
jgi:hypothetical protein